MLAAEHEGFSYSKPAEMYFGGKKMKSRIHLSEHFTYSKLLQFTLPPIVMNIFASLYIIADGFFVANFVGKTEFASVNLIMPVLNILGTIGYMFGVGGSALIAKRNWTCNDR